ncbi:copper chaperone PCu(A)C [Denitrobaculum tricleocarpae]|uniref:Copper chaperone PCu(A)C n=2 Tax=Denitrobaculum tricleocarpae TaxID=2591009 RepID=A0A545T5P8_9PROT|nr:copper chaperone PCu(A)C [Denitrobaculum tricleocarpae]
MTGALVLGGLALSGSLSSSDLQAHEFKKGDLMIDHPFARASIPDRPGAAYVTIKNMGGEDDRLVSASSPKAGRVELHTHIMENGVARMRKVEAIEVPAGGTAELKPGGDHIMLFKLDNALSEGETFPITLTFEKAGDVEVTVNVEAMGSGGMNHEGMKHESMKHGDDMKKTQ